MNGEQKGIPETSKLFEIVECKRAKVVVEEFDNKQVKRVMIDEVGDGGNWMGFSLTGPAYFINDYGKTVATIQPEVYE